MREQSEDKIRWQQKTTNYDSFLYTQQFKIFRMKEGLSIIFFPSEKLLNCHVYGNEL